MSSGIRLAKEGKSVEDHSQSNMYVDSDTPLLKIKSIIRGEFTYNHSVDELVDNYIYHNLGYVPAFLMFIDRKATGERMLATIVDTDFDDSLAGGDKDIFAFARPTTSSIIYTLSGDNDGIYGYTLIIFYDQIAGDNS